MRSRRPEILLSIFCCQLAAGAAFDPVKDVTITVSKGILSLSLPVGAHLKVAHFKVVLKGQGHLKVGPLPAPSDVDDTGDPIWRAKVAISLAGEGLDGSSLLEVTYQPCTEGPGGRCYLPLKRILKPAPADLNPVRPPTAEPSRP